MNGGHHAAGRHKTPVDFRCTAMPPPPPPARVGAVWICQAAGQEALGRHSDGSCGRAGDAWRRRCLHADLTTIVRCLACGWYMFSTQKLFNTGSARKAVYKVSDGLQHAGNDLHVQHHVQMQTWGNCTAELGSPAWKPAGVLSVTRITGDACLRCRALQSLGNAAESPTHLPHAAACRNHLAPRTAHRPRRPHRTWTSRPLWTVRHRHGRCRLRASEPIRSWPAAARRAGRGRTGSRGALRLRGDPGAGRFGTRAGGRAGRGRVPRRRPRPGAGVDNWRGGGALPGPIPQRLLLRFVGTLATVRSPRAVYVRAAL